MNKIYLMLVVFCFSVSSYALDSISVSEGVIVDKNNEIFFLMSSEKNLIALQSSGETLWQLPVNAKPLFIQGDYLVSMKDASEVGVLNLMIITKSTGDFVKNLNIGIPKTVLARIDYSYDKKFDIDVRFEKGKTYLVWHYKHKKVGGAYNINENRLIENTGGSFKIDFDTKGVKLAATPVNLTEKQKAGIIIPKELKTNWDNREIVTQPVALGDNYHSIGYDSGRAFIKKFRKSDGRASGHIELKQPLSHLYKLSAEKEYVAIPQRLAKSPFYHYDWSINDLLDGQKIGSIKSPYSSGDYYVKSNKIYYVEGPWKRRMEEGKYHTQSKSLIGYDFSLDKQMWRIEIRDTRYFGATPP